MNPDTANSIKPDEEIANIVSCQNKLISAALTSFQQEVSKADADKLGFGPDGAAIEADFIGVKLFLAQQHELASILYRMLAEATVRWRKQHNQHRHAGRFFANQGAALAALGDVDRACIAFWRAAREDEVSCGTPTDQSFALLEMFDHSFGRPAREFALESAKTVDFRATSDQIAYLSSSLATSKYAFLAYLHIGKIHETEAQDLESDFSYLQKLNVIRSLSVLLEGEIRKVCGTHKESIFKSLEKHPDPTKIPWFKAFDDRRKNVGAITNTTKSVDDQLREAMATTTTSEDERFWRSLLVGYIVRNYSAHQMDITPSFLRSSFKIVVGHIVNAMIHAPKYK